MFKRAVLFFVTNIAILAVIMAILSFFNIKPYLSQHGINYQTLLLFAMAIGFSGSLISLFISKWMAKHAYSISIIEKPIHSHERWLVSTVDELSRKAKISMPEVGIYESDEPNAFATGWNKNNSLVAVSTGLLYTMNKEELTGVLGHEVSHIANGDMVTMALIQGVVNTFVIFFARIAAFFVTQLINRGENNNGVYSFAYYGTAIVFEFMFGILASIIVMAFSRYREFRADKGSAQLTSSRNMIMALNRLRRFQNVPEDNRAPALSSFKISRSSSVWWSLLSSHPPLEERIKALEKGK